MPEPRLDKNQDGTKGQPSVLQRPKRAQLVAEMVIRAAEQESRPHLKQRLIQEVVPNSMVPISVSTFLLFYGVNADVQHCGTFLPQFCVVAGTLALLIGVVETLCHHVVTWVLRDEFVTLVEAVILTAIKVISRASMVAEFLVILSGGVVTLIAGSTMQFSDPAAANYCSPNLFAFTSIFFGSVWIIVAFAGGCLAWIWASKKMTGWNFARNRHVEKSS